jgi:hypothetical protein
VSWPSARQTRAERPGSPAENSRFSAENIGIFHISREMYIRLIFSAQNLEFFAGCRAENAIVGS